jgi:hypothetical protein
LAIVCFAFLVGLSESRAIGAWVSIKAFFISSVACQFRVTDPFTDGLGDVHSQVAKASLAIAAECPEGCLARSWEPSCRAEDLEPARIH